MTDFNPWLTQEVATLKREYYMNPQRKVPFSQMALIVFYAVFVAIACSAAPTLSSYQTDYYEWWTCKRCGHQTMKGINTCQYCGSPRYNKDGREN